MLDKNFIDERREELLLEKDRLEKSLKGVAYQENGRYKPKYPEVGADEEDNELEVMEFEQNIDIEKNLSTMLEETNLALKKIEDGTYGFCDNCQQEIDPARLKAYPQAISCIKCDPKP